jgi:hypothetical protein
VVERLVKTNLPRLSSRPTATIDQIAYEFYKQALAIFGLRLYCEKPTMQSQQSTKLLPRLGPRY